MRTTTSYVAASLQGEVLPSLGASPGGELREARTAIRVSLILSSSARTHHPLHRSLHRAVLWSLSRVRSVNLHFVSRMSHGDVFMALGRVHGGGMPAEAGAHMRGRSPL